jgi:hypothetical protein
MNTLLLAQEHYMTQQLYLLGKGRFNNNQMFPVTMAKTGLGLSIIN